MKKNLFSQIIDFFSENFYKNFLFIMAYSDSIPHIERLKLFNKNNKSFIQTYLAEPNFQKKKIISQKTNSKIIKCVKSF